MRKLLALLILLSTIGLTPLVGAGETPLLTATGAIAVPNGYRFNERAFLSLRQHTIKTSTTWTPLSEFTGPRLSEVLAQLGAKGKMVEIHCLDGYSYAIPIAELARYEPILAHSMNGKRLRASDFGPLFLVYPRDQFPDELRTPVAEAKFAWQIVGLNIK